MKQSNSNIETLLTAIAAHQAVGLSVYFLGIGGIGMSALARYFNSRGLKVTGYDKTETELTKQLVAEGMHIHYTDDVNLIDRDASFIVYTPALPSSHAEYNYFLEHDYLILKRSEVLGLITKSSFNICVAGTHGKTTTSTMIAHILRDAGDGCNAFLGGISSNYGTNFWSSEQNICVAEADEYDRSFLKLSPDIAVITAADPDHLDIYGTAEAFREAFVQFSEKVKVGGCLIAKYGLNLGCGDGVKMLTYSLEDQQADCYAIHLNTKDGSYFFDLMIEGVCYPGFVLNMGGIHNVENAIAAISATIKAGVPVSKIQLALERFKGVKRRFEYVLKEESFVMIDDYAHHPKELTALIQSARSMFANRKCTIVFQPHLYSRTRDFAAGFSAALDLADEVYLLPIYPARELPMPGVESEMIAEGMKSAWVQCCSKSTLMDILSERISSKEIDLLITAGAGDIDTLVEPIQKIFSK